MSTQSAFYRWWDSTNKCNLTMGLTVPAHVVKAIALDAFAAGQEQAWKLSTPDPIPVGEATKVVLRDEDIQAVAQRCKPELKTWIAKQIEAATAPKSSAIVSGNKTTFTYSAGPLSPEVIEAMRKDNDRFLAGGPGAGLGAYGPYDVHRLLNTIEDLQDKVNKFHPGLVKLNHCGIEWEKRWTPEKKWHWVRLNPPPADPEP